MKYKTIYSLTRKLISLFLVLLSTYQLHSNEVYDLNSRQVELDNLICILATNDAITYHGKTEIHFVLGFFTGPPGVLYTYFRKYGLSERTRHVSENKHLFETQIYFDCYTQTVQKRLFLMSLLGWISSTFILITIIILMRYFF